MQSSNEQNKHDSLELNLRGPREESLNQGNTLSESRAPIGLDECSNEDRLSVCDENTVLGEFKESHVPVEHNVASTNSKTAQNCDGASQETSVLAEDEAHTSEKQVVSDIDIDESNSQADLDESKLYPNVVSQDSLISVQESEMVDEDIKPLIAEHSFVGLDGSSNQSYSDLSQPSTSTAMQDNSYICEISQYDDSTLSVDSVNVKDENLCLGSNGSSDDDEFGEHFFETDHPALKHNRDYRRLLYTVLEVEAMRSRAIRDLDRLYECQDEALADPIGYVERLQKGENLDIPGRQEIPKLPEIDWNKYVLTRSEVGCSKRQLTRQSTKSAKDFITLLTKPESSSKTKTRPDQAKSSKFNKPWSAEEQKKLENLLVEYPPEEIESRRWEKIAHALKNRTPTQVASRVQKYFIKLLKAGMPIPGRQPNASYVRKPRRQVIRQQPSTFFASFAPPVLINEEDEKLSGFGFTHEENYEDDNCSDMDISDDEVVSPELRNTPEYEELMTIKRALKRKKFETPASHIGFQCTYCECKPIIGVRYHCTECPPNAPVDFCQKCVDCMYEVGAHTALHNLDAIYHSVKESCDSDYHFSGSNPSYLDPNYMPLT